MADKVEEILQERLFKVWQELILNILRQYQFMTREIDVRNTLV